MADARASPFVAQRVALTLPLPAAWERRAIDGARIALDAMLLRYQAALGGVLVAYGALAPASATVAATDITTATFMSSHALPSSEEAAATRPHHKRQIGAGGKHGRSGSAAAGDGAATADDTAVALPAPLCRLVDELPSMHTRLVADVLVFAPRAGDQVDAAVTAVGAGYISCLVAGLFNANVAGADLAAAGYSFVTEDNAWCQADGTVVGVGSEMRLTVTAVAYSYGLVALTCEPASG